MPRHPDPPPLRTRDALTVAVGTAVWAVLLVACLVEHTYLSRHGHDWWLAACAIATGLGLVGIAYCARRSKRIASSSRSSSAASSTGS